MVGIFYIKNVRACEWRYSNITLHIFVSVNTEVSETALTNEFYYSMITLYKLLKENYKLFLFVFLGRWKSRAGGKCPFCPLDNPALGIVKSKLRKSNW